MEQESGHQSESIDFCGHVGSLRGLLGVGWVTMVAEMGNGVQKHRQADAYRAEDHWDRLPGLTADLGAPPSGGDHHARGRPAGARGSGCGTDHPNRFPERQ